MVLRVALASVTSGWEMEKLAGDIRDQHPFRERL